MKEKDFFDLKPGDLVIAGGRKARVDGDPQADEAIKIERVTQ